MENKHQKDVLYHVSSGKHKLKQDRPQHTVKLAKTLHTDDDKHWRVQSTSNSFPAVGNGECVAALVGSLVGSCKSNRGHTSQCSSHAPSYLSK